MSRQSTRGRPPQCSSSSAGSATYQGASGATSPVYHLPQDSFHHADVSSNYRKKNFEKPPDDPLLRDHHSYYNIQKPCCNKESIADTHSYQYLNDDRSNKPYSNIENAFSDDSSYYDYQRNFDRDHKFTNNLYSEYESDYPIGTQPAKVFQKHELRFQSTRASHHNNVNNINNPILKKELLVNHDVRGGGLDRVYPEAPLSRAVPDEFLGSLQRRIEIGRISGRNTPDSAVGSAIVDGCGGHCVAFETVCSYVLKVFFVMGILIGISLCIAGVVLRRTKSRDLQVLVYIGVMSAMVCSLLLIVQCRVRSSLRNRKRAVRMARTSTIPLGDIRPVQQPLINVAVDDRAMRYPPNIQSHPQEIIVEQPGVPWWRRDDLLINRV